MYIMILALSPGHSPTLRGEWPGDKANNDTYYYNCYGGQSVANGKTKMVVTMESAYKL